MFGKSVGIRKLEDRIRQLEWELSVKEKEIELKYQQQALDKAREILKVTTQSDIIRVKAETEALELNHRLNDYRDYAGLLAVQNKTLIEALKEVKTQKPQIIKA